MRTINIIIMLGITAISALLGTISLITGLNNFPNSVAATAALIGLFIISIAYAILLLRGATRSSGAHLLAFLLYAVSATSGVAASSNIGLIPYIMESMKLNFTSALSYVLPILPICASISIASYIITHIYIQRQSKNPMQAPSASA
ncbi:hypothetical protein JQX08_08420 [Pseudomonas sp. UL073]|uniref:MotA/TolQ/ExbB proton channel domain-containing protein n=1 Tax=Zestomonas insulae TaxID=2809017 RepID=A0ABS2ICD8_9GAMM|nr:hypothetical protein [Pseudomonas insulae]MBM7060732.1 hypothetical protein [Pseudomonas insulae]